MNAIPNSASGKNIFCLGRVAIYILFPSILPKSPHKYFEMCAVVLGLVIFCLILKCNPRLMQINLCLTSYTNSRFPRADIFKTSSVKNLPFHQSEEAVSWGGSGTERLMGIFVTSSSSSPSITQKPR